MQHTLGGERLGSGRKMKVDTKTFNRSTFNQSRLFKTTMSAGTLVPFLLEYGLPGTTFDIDLDCFINTHPTIGPLFASAKVQLDVFQTPLRLYNSKMHNNALNIGRQMSTIKLPQIELLATKVDMDDVTDLDNMQVNPSSLLAYLGIRGAGIVEAGALGATAIRSFNAIPILAYWDIVKNYYSFKQMDTGAVIHTPSTTIISTIVAVVVIRAVNYTIPQYPVMGSTHLFDEEIRINFTGTQPIPSQVILNTSVGELTLEQLAGPFTFDVLNSNLVGHFNDGTYGTLQVYNWRYRTANDLQTGQPAIATFPLENIDLMREQILAADGTIPFITNDSALTPYTWLSDQPGGIANVLSSQEGLALKTYQSDLFNNWLKTENIEAITTQTGIDVSGGVLTIDQFIVSKKVWDMLNAINVSGGTYDDWQQVVYDHDGYRKCETPMYMGGLIKELVFQEVVSNALSEEQPLGTLAGKGTLSKKHKGGHMVIRIDEPSIIMGIISITPRIEYSQGNEWHTHLQTMDDLHKPYMDGIGFQDLITEQMAWYETQWNGTEWVQLSAGKQPAWLNYMTAVSKTYGNFAVGTYDAVGEMFMTYNRRYEWDGTGTPHISDLTVYIDPSKYNYIFAQTALDAQNYWTQISIDLTSRRKMSSKIMPHI